jgi:hypothetical protein
LAPEKVNGGKELGATDVITFSNTLESECSEHGQLNDAFPSHRRQPLIAGLAWVKEMVEAGSLVIFMPTRVPLQRAKLLNHGTHTHTSQPLVLENRGQRSS